MTTMTISELAEKCSDAYSVDNYKGGFGSCVAMMRRRGYNDDEIEAVLRSKWTRWAADSSDKNYGYNNSADLGRFLDTMKAEPGSANVTELVEGTFGIMVSGI